MAQSDAKPEFHVISISKAELVVRLIEASTGIPRPPGISADEIVDSFRERSPIPCGKMEACALTAVSYFAECMAATIPETTLSHVEGAIQ